MVKTLLILIFLLATTYSFAEQDRVKCDSGDDCYKNAEYLNEQRKDIKKSFKYYTKGCEFKNLNSCTVLLYHPCMADDSIGCDNRENAVNMALDVLAHNPGDYFWGVIIALAKISRIYEIKDFSVIEDYSNLHYYVDK